MLLSYYRRPLFLLLLLYAGGILVFKERLLNTGAALPFGLPRSGALVEGRVADYPVAVPGGRRFSLETSAVYNRPLKTGLMVYAPAAAGVSYGDTVSMLADIEAPPGAQVPGSLDWADYLAKRGIKAQARAGEIEVTARANAFIRLAGAFRASALRTFEASLNPEAASVLGGVVLGEKKSVPPSLKTAFQDSGAMHLLVASGSNVGFVVAVVYFLSSRLGLKRKYSGLAALGLAGFYVIAAGFDAPLVRAYLMFSAGLCAWLLRREAGAFHALTAACLLILLVSPRALFDAGFQMSFLAAYGLVVGISLWGGYFRAGGLRGKAAGLLLVSFFAQLCLYPLLAVYFHKISLVSLVANMVLVPASGLAMGLGFLMAFFAKAEFILEPLAYAVGAFMDLFIKAVRWFAAWPFASVRVAEPSAWFVGGFFVLAFAFLHAPLLGFKSRRLYAVCVLGLAVMAAGPLKRAAASGPENYRALLFGDTNTSCAFVYAGKGLYVVNPGLEGKKLAEAVLSGGGRTVEGVLLTSLEERNFSGLASLAGLVEIKRVLLPYGRAAGELPAILAELEKGGTAIEKVWPGETAAGGSGIAALWGGTAHGYCGRGEVDDWTIGPVKIGEGGGAVSGPCGGSCAAAGGVRAQKGRTVSMDFKFP